MGEAKVKEAAKQLVHRVLVEWVPRQILIVLIRQGQGKGLAHARAMRRALLALMGSADEGEWKYLEDGTVNLTLPPGVQRVAVRPLPAIVDALVKEEIIKDVRDVESIVVTVNERLDCPADVLAFTAESIEFILKVVEESNTRNVLLEKIADAVGDLEDAKKGTYELPAEVDGQAEAVQAS